MPSAEPAAERLAAVRAEIARAAKLADRDPARAAAIMRGHVLEARTVLTERIRAEGDSVHGLRSRAAAG